MTSLVNGRKMVLHTEIVSFSWNEGLKLITWGRDKRCWLELISQIDFCQPLKPLMNRWKLSRSNRSMPGHLNLLLNRDNYWLLEFSRLKHEDTWSDIAYYRKSHCSNYYSGSWNCHISTCSYSEKPILGTSGIRFPGFYVS